MQDLTIREFKRIRGINFNLKLKELPLSIMTTLATKNFNYIIQGFPYWGDMGSPPPLAESLLPFHREKIAPPNFSTPPPIKNNFHVITQYKPYCSCTTFILTLYSL